MIKAVFFDVGGTLIRPFPSVGAIYSQAAARHGIEAPADLLDQRFKEEWKKQKAKRLSVDKPWWRELVEATFTAHSFKNFDAFFEDVYRAFAAKEAWAVFPDVRVTLEELRQRKLRLAVASNWDERLPDLLRVLDLDSAFECHFTSFQMGMTKPNPHFFKRALEAMKLHPLEAIHVGDDFEEDVKCAEAAGMRAYLLDREARPLSSRSLKNLSEITLRI